MSLDLHNHHKSPGTVDVFHFAAFGKLKYMHRTIGADAGLQWTTASSSEKEDSVIAHL